MNKREEFYAKQEELIKKVYVDISDRTALSCLATESANEIIDIMNNTSSLHRAALIMEARTIKLLLEKTLKGLKESVDEK